MIEEQKGNLRRYRHWTPGLKAAFLEALGRLGTVTAAAEGVGVCRGHAYELRRSDPLFAEGFAQALEEAADRLEEEARRRAVEGVEHPIIHGGKRVLDDDGQPLSIRRYSDGLLLALLKARRPLLFRERLNPDGHSPHAPTPDLSALRQRLEKALAEAIAREAVGRVPAP